MVIDFLGGAGVGICIDLTILLVSSFNTAYHKVLPGLVIVKTEVTCSGPRLSESIHISLLSLKAV